MEEIKNMNKDWWKEKLSIDLAAEHMQRPGIQRDQEKPGYLEMKETKVLTNGVPTTVTTFEKEEEISEIEKASEHTLAYLDLGGTDLTTRQAMPHFFRFNIFSNNVKEALDSTKDYLDYLQAEAAAATKPKQTKIEMPEQEV